MAAVWLILLSVLVASSFGQAPEGDASEPTSVPEPEEPPPKPRVQGNCDNLFIYDFTCNTLANSGHCESELSKAWMSRMCSKACNTCDALKHETGKDCENRHNDNQCEAWAVWGKCADGGAIHRECAQSCNTCAYMNEEIRQERLDWLEPEPEEGADKPQEPPAAEPEAPAE